MPRVLRNAKVHNLRGFDRKRIVWVGKAGRSFREITEKLHKSKNTVAKCCQA